MKGRIILSFLIVVLIATLCAPVAWSEEQKTAAAQPDTQKWLFLCYWELNHNMATMEHVQIAKKLMDAGLFPPEGVEIIRFDRTASGWGVTVFTADSPQAAVSLVDLWKVAGEGFFKEVKVSPAMPVNEIMGNAARLYRSIQEAEAKMKAQQGTAK